MLKSEAFIERGKYLSLIGKQFDKSNEWEIKDIVVSSFSDIGLVCKKMYDDDLTNEQALLLFPDAGDKYDVYVISHQWPWGSGDLLHETLEVYIKHHLI